jgi:hypothetical protein
MPARRLAASGGTPRPRSGRSLRKAAIEPVARALAPERVGRSSARPSQLPSWCALSADAAGRRIRCKIRANRAGNLSGGRATASRGDGMRADRRSSGREGPLFGYHHGQTAPGSPPGATSLSSSGRARVVRAVVYGSEPPVGHSLPSLSAEPAGAARRNVDSCGTLAADLQLESSTTALKCQGQSPPGSLAQRYRASRPRR